MDDRLLLMHDPGEMTGNLEALASEAGMAAVNVADISEPCLQKVCEQAGRCLLLRIGGVGEVQRLVHILREMPETLRPYLILVTERSEQDHVATRERPRGPRGRRSRGQGRGEK